MSNMILQLGSATYACYEGKAIPQCSQRVTSDIDEMFGETAHGTAVSLKIKYGFSRHVSSPQTLELNTASFPSVTQSTAKQTANPVRLSKQVSRPTRAPSSLIRVLPTVKSCNPDRSAAGLALTSK